MAHKKRTKQIEQMRKETDLTSFRPQARNGSVDSVENYDHIKIILPNDLDELFYFLSTPIWNTYD